VTDAPRPAFSLASLNVHCGRDRYGEAYSVAAAIRQLDADVFVVQENWRSEASSHSIAGAIAADGGYEVTELDLLEGTNLYDLGVARDAEVNEDGTYSLAVASRLPVIATSHVMLPMVDGDVCARAAQVVVVDCPGASPIRIVNTHLTHHVLHSPGQLRCLTRAIDAEPVGMPTVIAGDLNMCRPAIRIARGYRAAVRGRTWPAWRPIAQLDHVLLSDDLAAWEAVVLDPVGSDHRPVRVCVRLAG
jgi:endonuclease/exonuclease/phosphatase family metal-dependent hydrolase